ncbi:uncharacterized protein [Henckelia pumila]|uniref:uncharacterized protein n=1 Tax=Henckelia pumila TaxID=405737 RepID=UPI003C6DBD01
MDTTVSDELKELKKKKKKLEETEVINEPFPGHYKSTKVREYDGRTDPEEHLARLKNVVMLHCYEDMIKCKSFMTTLVDSAQRWFEKLEPQSIRSFGEFREVFLQHFGSSKRYNKTAFSLFEVRKSREEFLRAYIGKFNKVCLEVSICAQEIKTTAFTQGLWEGLFFKFLVKKSPQDFEDLLARVEKYINMEEVQKKKKGITKREFGRDRVVK